MSSQQSQFNPETSINTPTTRLDETELHEDHADSEAETDTPNEAPNDSPSDLFDSSGSLMDATEVKDADTTLEIKESQQESVSHEPANKTDQ